MVHCRLTLGDAQQCLGAVWGLAARRVMTPVFTQYLAFSSVALPGSFSFQSREFFISFSCLDVDGKQGCYTGSIEQVRIVSGVLATLFAFLMFTARSLPSTNPRPFFTNVISFSFPLRFLFIDFCRAYQFSLTRSVYDFRLDTSRYLPLQISRRVRKYFARRRAHQSRLILIELCNIFTQ